MVSSLIHLLNDNILDWSKFKAFAKVNLIQVQMQEFLDNSVEKRLEKGENASYQHFLRSTLCFQKHLWFSH